MVRDLEIPCKSDLGSLAWKGYPNQRYEPKAEQKETKAKESIREILQDKNTLPPVKEIAKKGLTLL